MSATRTRVIAALVMAPFAIGAILLLPTSWLAMLAAYRTRSPRIVGAGVEEYRRVFSATLATVGIIAVALMIFRPEYARGYLAVALPLGLVGLAFFELRVRFGKSSHKCVLLLGRQVNT